MLHTFLGRPPITIFKTPQPACLLRKPSVFSLNAGTFSYSGACEQSSKMYSSEFLMLFFSPSANRMEQTTSCRPKVICVGSGSCRAVPRRRGQLLHQTAG